MSADSFLSYFQDELLALRRDAYMFGKRHGEVASRLGVEWGANPDPMVERLIESLAWFAARIRKDSQDKLPMAAQQVLRQLCPGLVRPVPSIGIASLTPADDLAEPRTIPAGSRFHCEGADGETIRWRTGWPVTLSRLEVKEARFCDSRECGLAAAPSGRCCFRLTFSGAAGTERVRLFLKGDPFSTHPLHEWIHTNLLDVFATYDGDAKAAPVRLGRDALRPAGLSPDDLVLPRGEYGHPAYQLIQEYFACPERFLFWDLFFPGQPGRRMTSVILPLRLPPPDTVSARYVVFDPCAVPVVNLSERLAEPIAVDHTRHCYPLETDRDRPDASEVYSVLEVEALFPGGPAMKIPYSGAALTRGELENPRLAWRWYERRRESPTGDGTDIELFFKCLDPHEMDRPFTAAVRTLCTNRNAASALGNNTRLDNDDEMKIQEAVMERSPTQQWDPVLSGDILWRLVSSMTLHRHALSGGNGLEGLKEILRLYAPPRNLSAPAQIDGMVKLQCRDTLAPLRPSRDRPMGGAANGHAFSLWLDPGAFRNGSPFLFASVIESFLALFAGINSFTQLTAYAGGNAELYAWPPRSGRQRL